MEKLITEKATTMFFSYGLRSVAMDDIAQAAGVSKKTLYQSFCNKEELVKSTVQTLLLRHQHELNKCTDEANDAVDELVTSAKTPFDIIAAINPNYYYELERSFPSIWKLTQQHKTKVVVPFLLNNLCKGMSEGLYRNDINTAFLADVRMQQLLTALSPRSFNGKMQDAGKLFLQFTEMYLHAIVTPIGKKLLSKYLKMNNEKQA